MTRKTKDTRAGSAAASKGGLNRRSFVKAAAAGAAIATAGSLPKRVFAMTQRTVTFTLPWLPNGSSQYLFVAKHLGYFKKRGIDIKLTRGYGSVASAQAVGQGKFDFGNSAAPASFLMSAKGEKILHLACASYSPAMGVAYLKSSGIKTPKDLEGIQMGCTVTSGEYPFLPAFAKRAGFDWSKVHVNQVDAKILISVLLQGKVKAISDFASSAAPEIITKGYDAGWFLYKDYGMPFYGQMLITQPERYKKDKALCEAVTDACIEGMMFEMLHPEESQDIFFKMVPEYGLTKTQRKAMDIETGLYSYLNIRPEVVKHGMGTIDLDSWNKMADLIMKNVAKPGDKMPNPSEILALDYIQNKYMFTKDQYAKVKTYGDKYAYAL